jgi:3'-5' exonuclease
MRKIIFDIETCCFPFEDLSESQQEYILRYAEKERDADVRLQKKEDAVRYLNLYPFTAKVIAIGILDVTKEKRFVYYEAEAEEEYFSEDNTVHFKGLPEPAMLESFWRIVSVTDQIVSFNGRGFDAPFVTLRSAINKIKPSKNLIGNRFDTSFHIDLLEQFTYFGLIRKFNLDFYCRAFGIPSPKTGEVNGNEVERYYKEGRIKEIAAYCAEDISATYELYKIWNEYLNFTEK